MPDGSTTLVAKPIRIPAKLRSITHVLDSFRVQRNIVIDLQQIEREEARQLAEVKKRERRIKEKWAKRKQRLLARRDRLATKEFEFATEHRDDITDRRAPNVARFALGRFIWRTRKVADLPETDKKPEDKARLDAFYAEVEVLGLTDKYVRTYKEPNRAALADKANATEVATLTSVSLIDRTRFTVELDDAPVNVVGTIEKDGDVTKWEYVKPEDRSRNK